MSKKKTNAKYEDVFSSDEHQSVKSKQKKPIKARLIFILVLAVLAAGILLVVANREKIALFLLPKNDAGVIDDVIEDIFEPEEVINVEYISKKLENISSLQTAKITYGCMVDFESGSTFLNSKSFSMFYEATASAGIDVSQIKVENNEGKYVVYLPEAKLEKPYIDPKSFVFYDKKQGLINKRDVEDTGKVLEYAEEDVKTQATTDQLLDIADSNAVSVISNLLLCFLNEGDFEIIPAVRNEVAKIKPPISSADIEEYDGKELTYEDLEKKLEEAGFVNIKTYPIEDLSLGFLTKDGAVESISIAGKDSFKKSSIFNADDEIVIKYHTKKTK